jgi:hypothetical protein
MGWGGTEIGSSRRRTGEERARDERLSCARSLSSLPPHLVLGAEAGDAVALLPKAGDGEAVLVLAAGQAASAGLADGWQQGGRGRVEERGLEAHRARGARGARALGRRVRRLVGVDACVAGCACCWRAGLLDELEPNHDGVEGDTGVGAVQQVVEICWSCGCRDGGHIGTLQYRAVFALAATQILTHQHR